LYFRNPKNAETIGALLYFYCIWHARNHNRLIVHTIEETGIWKKRQAVSFFSPLQQNLHTETMKQIAIQANEDSGIEECTHIDILYQDSILP
jgi:hypothetical protein